jgi:AcrR family transcriptional regulator
MEKLNGLVKKAAWPCRLDYQGLFLHNGGLLGAAVEQVSKPRGPWSAIVSETASSKRVTLSASDWEQQALEVIAEQGITALAIEPLARRMGITKGSFYWHFSSRESLLEQALQSWEEHDARNLATSMNAISDPRARLIAFVRGVSRERLTHNVYSALCAAADHPQVEPVLERVARRRMAQIARAFCELGFASETAEHRARLTYSVYLGFLQLQRQRQAPNLSSEDFDAYVEHVIATLIPFDRAGGQ